MNIYIGYIDEGNSKELYDALRMSILAKKYNLVFSNKGEKEPFDPKECIKNCEIMIADVTFPTVTLGIEMGWADNFNIDVICTCLKGTAIPSHLTRMSKSILPYTDTNEICEDIDWIIRTKYQNPLK